MKKHITLAVCFLFPLCLASQSFDKKVFNDVAKKMLLEYRNTRDSNRLIYTHSELADTNHIEFHLPVLMIKEPLEQHNYMFITPFIEKKFSPYNQFAIIKSKGGYLMLIVKYGVYEERVRIREGRDIPPPPKAHFFQLIGGNNIHPGDSDFPNSERFFTYERLKAYSDAHPEVAFFMIYNIPGIWGYRNNKLIKLEFTRKQIKELDGEEHYRDYLFPVSPNGLQKIIEGESFKVVITM